MADQHEPVEIDVNLAAGRPFPSRLSGEQRGRVMQEIGRLREQLGLIVSIATRARKGSLIEQRFRKLRETEHFEHPLRGLEALSHKLDVDRFPRDDKERRATMYALLRLRIAQRTVELVRAEGVLARLPEALAIHRMEGDLDVPMAFDRMGDGLTPPDLTERPFGDVAPLFKGPHHTFFLEKNSPPPRNFQTFIEQMQLAVTTHQEMRTLLATGRQFGGHGALAWMESGKRGAVTLYLHILAGLDMYAQAILAPPDVMDRQLNDFRYSYARNRVFIDPELKFPDALIAGLNAYRTFTRVSLEEFENGTTRPEAIVATTHAAPRGSRLHHFLPKDPVEFGAAIARESVLTLEALRRAPLINGGPRFKNPLPHGVAYLRYNAGDIFFLVIVMNLLRKIVFDELPAPKHAKNEQPPLDRLKRGMEDFTKPDKAEAWTVLRRWREESSTYFLREPEVRRQVALREAIAQDAASFSTELHGVKERRHMAQLNSEGQMDTAEPLLKAMNEKELWPDLLKAMVGHVGSGQKPWLGHSEFLDDIGLRALRFYYMHRGFEEAFQGVEPELER